MRRRIERMVIRWAVKRLAAIVAANPNMNYDQLGRYGVADIMKSGMDENAFIFD